MDSLCVYTCACVLLSWFFFFKQKTAYEMRISDWSSDVCSSDLTLLTRRRRGQSAPARLPPRGHHRNRPVISITTVQQAAASISAEPRLQIGRASCRERVCQYV